METICPLMHVHWASPDHSRVLHGCFTGASRVFHGSFTVQNQFFGRVSNPVFCVSNTLVSRVVHGWFTGGSRVVHGWFLGGSRVVHGSFTDGSRVFHGLFRVVDGTFTGCGQLQRAIANNEIDINWYQEPWNSTSWENDLQWFVDKTHLSTASTERW